MLARGSCVRPERLKFVYGRWPAVCYTDVHINMATTSYTKKTLGFDVEPAVTPPPPASETSFVKKPKLGSSKQKKKEIPEGLWTKCPKCEAMVFDKELDENLKVCPKCSHHFLSLIHISEPTRLLSISY